MILEGERFNTYGTYGKRKMEDGTLWVGDDSTGHRADEFDKPDHPLLPASKVPLQEKSYREFFGGGMPNPEI